MSTLVDVRTPRGPASRTDASRPWPAVALDVLARAAGALSRAEATREDLRRRRYAAHFASKS